MADTTASKAVAERRVGSTPTFGTKQGLTRNPCFFVRAVLARHWHNHMHEVIAPINANDPGIIRAVALEQDALAVQHA